MNKRRGSGLHQWVCSNIPIVMALILTCIVVAIASSLGHGRVSLSSQEGADQFEAVSRWDWFFKLPPNAMGDTLAGLLGALTLIWIIASVFHQSKELGDQREIMREQKREFELMVEAQNAQVRALEAQALIFEDEKRRRDQDVTRQYIFRIVRSIVSIIKYSDFLFVSWRPSKVISPDHRELLDHWSFMALGSPPEDVEDAFLFYSRSALKAHRKLKEILVDETVVFSDLNGGLEDRYSVFMSELRRLSLLCSEAVTARSTASSIEMELLAHLRIDDFRTAIDQTLEAFEMRFE